MVADANAATMAFAQGILNHDRRRRLRQDSVRPLGRPMMTRIAFSLPEK